MKVRNFLALLAAACMTVSCTNELAEFTPEGGPQENELKLVFSSSTNGEIYPKTRAIATAEENAIKDLTVYVFGSTTETGTYYLMDEWKSGDTQDNAKNNFKLQPSGSNYKASIYPRKVKDAKYLKLYCVANSDVYENFSGTPAKPTKCNEGNLASGGTAMTTFDNYFTNVVKPSTQSGTPIVTPLAMSGIMSDPLHVTGNYGVAAIELKRRVARFDIDNNAARTKLTIKSISIDQAQSSSYLFSTKNGYYPNQAINYPEVEYTKLPNANLGVTTSAMYVHPSAAHNNLMLVIKGLYAGKNEVTYRVKVARTEGEKSQNIKIDPNHRYSLKISEVTSSEIVGYFQVEDWIDGGSVDVKPNYDKKPEIITDGVKAVAEKDPFTGVEQDKFWTQNDSTIRVAKDGEFTVALKAPGQCAVKIAPAKDFVTRAVSAVKDWLTVTEPVITEAEGMRISTFTFKVAATVKNNAMPFDVTFINTAASVDSAFMLRYRVLPPAILDHTTNIEAASNSDYAGNTSNGTLTNTKGSEKMTLNVGKKFYVDVCSPYLAVPTCEDLTKAGHLAITEVKRNKETKVVTYCFDFKSMPEDIDTKNDYKVTFKNTFDASGADVSNPISVDYKLTLASTEKEVNAVIPDGTQYENSLGAKLTAANSASPTGTMFNIDNNILHIGFEKEMIVEVPETEKENITVTLKKPAAAALAAAEQFVYEIKVAKKLTDTDQQAGAQIKIVDIKFKNKLDARKITTLKLTINKEEEALEAKNPEGGTFNNSEKSELTLTSPKTPTGKIDNKLNNVLFIAFDKEVDPVVPEEYKANITVTKQSTGTNKVYEIKIVKPLDEGSTLAGAEIKKVSIQFKNKMDNRKVTTLQLSVNKEAAEGPVA